MTPTLHIHGFGSYTPAKCLTNADLETFVDTSDKWIVSRTGIQARHMLADGEQGSDAGKIASEMALADAGLEPQAITHVLVATCTPDYLCPSTACILSGKLGIHGAMAFDLNAACSGFVYGLDVAQGIVLAHPEAHVLLVGSEALTRRLNWQDRSTCVLFGDGAGAVVLGGEPKATATPGVAGSSLVEDVICHAEGSHASLLTVGGGSEHRIELGQPVGDDFYIQMHGTEVFRHAVRSMTSISRSILERNNLSFDDVDVFIPHQANLRIIEAVGERLKVPAEKVFINVQEYANTSAATIPLALEKARAQGFIKPGMRVLLTTFGGGFTWGAALLRFAPDVC